MSVWQPNLDTALRDLSTECDGWVQGNGGAWAWCDRCGLRADRHPGSPIAGTVRRIVDRVRA